MVIIVKTDDMGLVGAILFLTGLIMILVAWNFSYPIHIPGSAEEVMFVQFYPLIWPGILLSLIGLFLAGYYSKRKSVKTICVSFFPIVLYSYVFFFSYTPTSDSGAVKAMFEIFHETGINPLAEPYFHYPVFFTLNEMVSRILRLTAESVAALLFLFFGVLLANYLFLFLSRVGKDGSYQIAFLGVPFYFSALYFHLNYQWAPQTLALVFLILLLFLFDRKKVKYKILALLIFIALVF
ncbi:MAG TPA: hypothetical protein ENI42_02165, partial [Thermoplasmatales archaeon]|nr:hypothetical protein [Thermoplasmatales archaeon]